MNKKQFIKWLKSKRLYSKFVKLTLGHHSDIDSIAEYLSLINDSRVVLFSAFIWTETDEGREFWDKVNSEWFKYLNIDSNA